MRMVSGCLLLLIAELSFAHAHQIGFPYQVFVRSVLLPASLISAGLGVGLLTWGLWSEVRKSPCP